MTRSYQKFDLHTGDPINDDDDVLRDGQRISVPMNMRDAMSELQRAVAEDKAARRVGLADSASLHRPGQRFSVDEAARRHVEEVYLDEKRKLQDAWRTPVVDTRGQQPGDQCTIDGQPGHLDHRIRCVPDKRQDSVRPVYDAAEAQRIKDAAYAEMCRELEEVWRR